MQIRPIVPGDVPQLARFLERSATAPDPRQAMQAPPPLLEQERLASRQFDNPFARSRPACSHVLVDERGVIAGALLASPWEYRLGQHTLRALAGGPFFVDSGARLQGFFLFRQYLNASGVDFWYAATCNGQSGTLWQRFEGVPLPASDIEYLLVFRPGPLLEEFALRRHAPAALARVAQMLGSPARLLTLRRRSRLTICPTDDWSRMADIAEAHRDPNLLTCHRTEAYLRWTYQQPLREGQAQVYRFQDHLGREGWFALRQEKRGAANQIRCAGLLDVIWPRANMDFRSVLSAIADVAAAHADALSIHPRPGIALKARPISLIRRRLPAPQAFVRSSSSQAAIDMSRIADFATADAV